MHLSPLLITNDLTPVRSWFKDKPGKTMYGNKVQLHQLEDPGKDPFGGESWIDLSPKDWIRRRPRRKWVGIIDLYSFNNFLASAFCHKFN